MKRLKKKGNKIIRFKRKDGKLIKVNKDGTQASRDEKNRGRNK